MEKTDFDSSEKIESSICGTVVGTATANEFFIAIAPGSVNVQDFVCVEADTDEDKRLVWGKIVELERSNPLFPREAAHELAYNKIQAIDTILSISREMILGKCQIIGMMGSSNDLEIVSYPVKPTSAVYKPKKEDLEKFISSNFEESRKIPIGTLKNRPEVEVFLDAHTIVARHLAILAMTGAGKTVAARKIIEGIIEKEYPIIIFDPHKDYVNLMNTYPEKVKIYYPKINVAHEDEDTIYNYISSLSGIDLTQPQEDSLRKIIKILKDSKKLKNLADLTKNVINKSRDKFTHFWDVQNNTWNIINTINEIKNKLKEKGVDKESKSIYESYKEKFSEIDNSLYNANIRTLYKLATVTTNAAKEITRMEKMNRMTLNDIEGAIELPSINDINKIIKIDQTAVICLSGYTNAVRQTFAEQILTKLVDERLEEKIPKFLIVLEEAHNFIPSSSEMEGISTVTSTIKQIATEGRKFGMGLILISQRPTRLNPLVLSQCNSFIILRIVNPADQRYIKDTIEYLSTDELNILPNLLVGEALIAGQFVKLPLFTSISMSKTTGAHEEEDNFKDNQKWANDQKESKKK